MRRLRRRSSNLAVLSDPDSKSGKTVFIALKDFVLKEVDGAGGKKTVLKRTFISPVVMDIAGEKRHPKVSVSIYWEPSVIDRLRMKRQRERELVAALSPKVK